MAKDWVDWQKIAINYAEKKKGKPMPKLEDKVKLKGFKGEFVVYDDVLVDNAQDVIQNKKALNDLYLNQGNKKYDWNWWGDKPNAPLPPAQPMEQFFEIPNPAKFIEQEGIVPPAPEPAIPDPYNDNLQMVRKELQDIVDYAGNNGEEPPLTLVRALNRIKALEKGGDDWIAGYNAGWADAGGDKKHLGDLQPVAIPDPQFPDDLLDEDFDPEPDDDV